MQEIKMVVAYSALVSTYCTGEVAISFADMPLAQVERLYLH